MNDTAYLQHIRDAIQDIRDFVGDRAEEALVTEPDKLIQAGVVRELEIIGEAAGKLSTATKDRAPHIPWRVIADMRNKLVHEYFGVDYELVLKVLEDRLQELDDTVQELLRTL